MSRKLNLLTSVLIVLVLAGAASAVETLVVPQGTTHTVTGKEAYTRFEVAGTLIVEQGGQLTVGPGAEKSEINGLDAKVIVNGGTINLNSRLDVGKDAKASIIMNGGLFRIGSPDSYGDAGDLKVPDDDGGSQRIILNGGILWAHRCQMKYALTDDARIIVAGGEMRIDAIGVGEDPGEPESYDPKDWLNAGRIQLGENYTELLLSPNTNSPTQNYYSISATAAKPTESLVVPQGTTHTVTGREAYTSLEVAGTLIVEKGGVITAGLGTDRPRSTIDGPQAKVIVNGGTIKVNSRINVGYAGNATIIINDGLFRVGKADSSLDFGDIKLPDADGGTQRIILNGGILWATRCQVKTTEFDDAKIIIAGGEMRLDMLGETQLTESYDPDGWLVAGKLELADKNTNLVIEPKTPTQNYYRISASATKPAKQAQTSTVEIIGELPAGYGPANVNKDGSLPYIKPAMDIPGNSETPGTAVRSDGNITVIGQPVDLFTDSENPGVKWNGSVWYIDSDPKRLIVNADGDLEWAGPKGGDSFKTSIPKQRLSEVGDIAEVCYMFMSDGPHGCGQGRNKKCLVSDDDDCYENDITCIAGTSDIRIGLFEEYPDPEDPGDTDSRGYNFRFGPNMMAGPTRWVDYKGEVHKTGMFGNRGMSSNSGLMGVIPGFELEPGKFSFLRVRLERISSNSILLSIKLNGRTIEYLDVGGENMPEGIDVFAVSMRNGRPYSRIVFRAM